MHNILEQDVSIFLQVTFQGSKLRPHKAVAASCSKSYSCAWISPGWCSWASRCSAFTATTQGICIEEGEETSY